MFRLHNLIAINTKIKCIELLWLMVFFLFYCFPFKGRRLWCSISRRDG